MGRQRQLENITRQARRLPERPDRIKLLGMRMKLLARFETDLDEWYDIIKFQALNPLTSPAQARIIEAVLGKIIPEVKEYTPVVDGLPPSAAGGGFKLVINNVNRGTKSAREKTLEMRAARNADGSTVHVDATT